MRDLWALRLQDFTLRINATLDDDEDDERELFSSQPETDSSDDSGFKSSGGRYLEWPRLLDSVGLCYLAAILMRLPVCVSDFHRFVHCQWAFNLSLRCLIFFFIQLDYTPRYSLYQGRKGHTS